MSSMKTSDGKTCPQRRILYRLQCQNTRQDATILRWTRVFLEPLRAKQTKFCNFDGQCKVITRHGHSQQKLFSSRRPLDVVLRSFSAQENRLSFVAQGPLDAIMRCLKGGRAAQQQCALDALKTVLGPSVLPCECLVTRTRVQCNPSYSYIANFSERVDAILHRKAMLLSLAPAGGGRLFALKHVAATSIVETNDTLFQLTRRRM